MYSCGRANGS